MAYELGSAAILLRGLLNGDPLLTSLLPGGIHSGEEPQGGPLPYLVFGYAGGNDINGAGVRAVSDTMYSVIIVSGGPPDPAGLSQTNFLSVQQALDRVDELLDETTTQVEGTTAGDFVRITFKASAPIQMIERLPGNAGVRYNRQGRMYRLLLRAGKE